MLPKERQSAEVAEGCRRRGGALKLPKERQSAEAAEGEAGRWSCRSSGRALRLPKERQGSETTGRSLMLGCLVRPFRAQR